MASDRDELKRNYLKREYAAKSADELLELYSFGTLTDVAYDVLETELGARGLPIPTRREERNEADDGIGKRLFRSVVGVGLLLLVAMAVGYFNDPDGFLEWFVEYWWTVLFVWAIGVGLVPLFAIAGAFGFGGGHYWGGNGGGGNGGG